MKNTFHNYTLKIKKTIRALMYCSAIALCSVSTLNAQSVEVYETRGDQSVLGTKQTSTSFRNGTATGATISINEGNTSQSIDGFGFMLTQGSANVILRMNESTQDSLLNEIFNPVTGNGVSVVRISIGASDLSDSVYSYNMTPGDVNMSNFSLDGPDQRDLIPVLKKILEINPAIRILATPWTAPIWMKTNNSYIGGRLETQFYAAYARYFIRYFEEMRDQGIDIWAITPQNEPGNPFNEPSMSMNSTEQIDFVNNHLGPAIENSSFDTKIIAYDHNCDDLPFPIDVLNNSRFVDGAAFHLYDPGVNTAGMSEVHDATNKNIYFTEQFTSSNGNFDADFGWHTEHVVIGSLRNWSKTVIEWNLASDTNFEPRTPGGCTTCLGAVTVTGNTSFDRNVSYYIISQVSRFIKPGAVRTATSIDGILNVSFRNPDGSRVLLVYNRAEVAENVSVNWNGRSFQYNIAPRSAITFVWTAEPITTRPPTPNGLVATGGDEEVSLRWNQATNANSYNVQRATAAAGPFTTITTNLSATAYTDRGLQNNTTYFYRVQAVNDIGASGNSTVANATPRIVTIDAFTRIEAESFNSSTGIQTEDTSDVGGGLNVGFADTGDYLFFRNVDFGAGVRSVEARVASGADFTGTMEFRLGSVTGTLVGTVSFGDTGGYQTWETRRATINGATGINDLYAVFEGGEGVGNLNWFIFSNEDLGPPPSVPTGLSASAGNEQISLTWNAVNGATGYIVKRAVSPAGPFSTIKSNVTGTSYTNTGLNNGTRYYYTVAARNNAGTSADSEIVNGTPETPARSAFSQIEAETFNSSAGIRTENTSDVGGGENVGFADNNDFIAFNNIDFENGALSVDLRFASNASASGSIELRLGSETGNLIGTIPVGNTGGYQNWVTETQNITRTTGVRNLFVVFKGGNGIGNINWIRFQRNEEEVPVITPDTGGGNSAIVSGSIYSITNKESGRAMDVSGVSTANGARIHQWDFVNGDNQKWIVESVEGGLYKLTALHSGKVLDLVDGSLADGGEIQQYDFFNNPNQKWGLEATSDGYINIVSSRSDKLISIPQGQTSRGVRLIQSTRNNGDNQKWSFTLIPGAKELVGEANSNNLVLYPNPTDGSDLTAVFTTLPSQKSVTILIADMLGNTLSSTVHNLENEGVQNVQLSDYVSGLSSGLYFVRIDDLIQKFIKE